MKFKLLSFIALTALLTAGCKKSFLDVNTNPNALPTATPSFVLTNALNTSTSNLINANETGSYWSGQWTQSSSYILSTTTFSYQFTDGDFNYWDGIYDNLQDYQYVIDNADANDQPYFKGPAKVMKAYMYQALVDMYGNIPFSDALKGTSSLAPKFDDQKAVYENLITLLDEAITDLKSNEFASAFSGADIVFKGNTENWAKFANSLKLRILIHQVRISGRDSYITTEINKIVTEGSGFITGSDVGSGGSSFYLATAGKTNPIYDRWGYDANGAVRALARFPRPTKFLFDVLTASNDTFRLKRLAYAKGGENTAKPGTSTAPEVLSNYVGVPFGIASGFTAPASSYIGPSLFVKGEFSRPFILMTAAEIQFLLSEAKNRFPSVSLPENDQFYYEEGVKQSFRLLGVTDATTQANTLLTSGIADADWTASSDKLKAIATQKWIALTNFSGLEAWTEYRRTNLPLTPQASTVTSENRPLRLFYPSSEKGSNVNVAAQGAIDVFSTRLFWDVD
jgi:Starch-binding associating with outer membrane